MVSQKLIEISKGILCLLSEEGIILCTVYDVFHMLVVQEKMNYTMIIVILITIEQILKTVIQKNMKNYPFCHGSKFTHTSQSVQAYKEKTKCTMNMMKIHKIYICHQLIFPLILLWKIIKVALFTI